MKNIAHITFAGGGLIFPTHTDYDRELLVEHIEASARRYGLLRLEVNRRRCTIHWNAEGSAPCAACARPRAALSYRITGSTLCGPCAHQVLYAAPLTRNPFDRDDSRATSPHFLQDNFTTELRRHGEDRSSKVLHGLTRS